MSALSSDLNLNVSYTFQPGPLSGCLEAIPSKSAAHRALLAAALTGRTPPPIPLPLCEDIQATSDALRLMPFDHECTVDCHESGTTLRLLLPVIATRPLDGKAITVIGSGRLPERPMAALLQALRDNGAVIHGEHVPFNVYGGLHSGIFRICGNTSSQFISGLLFALPFLPGPSVIELTTPLESADYVRMTLDTLIQAGISNLPALRHAPVFTPGTHPVFPDGDWSNMAVWLCAAAIGRHTVTITQLSPHSTQGDKAICTLLQEFGASVTLDGSTVSVTAKAPLHGFDIDISPIPDLLPVLAVVAANATGTTRFLNAARLRLKESDRLESTATLLRQLGGTVTTTADSMTVVGSPLHGGTVDSCNDHRLVMAAALAAISASAPVTILNPQAVGKSYPQFFQHYQSLSCATTARSLERNLFTGRSSPRPSM